MAEWGAWTKDNILKDALKYRTVREYRENGASYYMAMYRKMLNICTSHMTREQKENGYWLHNEKRIIKESKKYKTMGDFNKKSPSAYGAAVKLKILHKIRPFMTLKGNHHRRKIYIIKFKESHSVYIGLSFDPKTRIRKHKESSKWKSNFKKYTYIITIEKKFLNLKEATNRERKLIKFYKNKGWNVINIRPGGDLGNIGRFWTNEKMINEVKNYKSFKELRDNNHALYIALHTYKLWDTVKNDLISKKRQLSDDFIINTLKKYKNLRDARLGNPKEYDAAKRRKLVPILKEKYGLISLRKY